MLRTLTRAAFAAALLTLSLFAAGCGAKAADPHAGHDHGADTAHAEPAAATAGAHSSEGMCTEHGVLEAMCTRCNPGLVPAFQAKGDWCGEHEYPESVCPICHPERGGRPASADDMPDDAPLDRSVLQFRSLASARDAGIAVAAAEAGADPAGLTVQATLVADASHRALVHATAPGVVRAVLADVGTPVTAGAPLARFESAAVGEARAALASARARVATARAAFARDSALHRADLASAQDELAARQELESARAGVAAAEAALAMHGAGAGGAGGAYLLRSPIAGVVTQRVAEVGASLDTDAMLFEVVDPAGLWAELEVPESRAAAVRVGQPVTLRVRGVERPVRAEVAFVSSAIEPHTRTLRARARLLDRVTRELRPNAWGEATVRTGGAERTVLVPREAIHEAKGVKLAFVRLAEDRFEVRRVEVGGAENGRVAVHAGLRPGEMVATTGSFLLKTETLKESIGAGCCDVEAPKER
ncbi:MAG: efflux RND transporter periplasmic adaptor subunit [Candidatus Eisenbacteria bacterium]